MHYREVGKTGEKVSALGFGTMRLPVIDGKDDQINEPLAIEMIRKAIDAGVNYVDTAWFYHSGTSESLCGKALAEGYRDKVFLADKLPPWLAESTDDCERILNTQLERCRTDHFDFYLLHCILEKNWPNVEKLKLEKWLEKVQADGRVRHLGFSFHDNPELFRHVVDYYDWSFCQIQYNYLNEKHQAGTEGYEYAVSKGLGVIVMEPLLGGALANPQGVIREMWDEAGYEPVDLALRWLWDKPGVGCILSGMTDMAQVEQNLALAENSQPGCLSDDERAFIAKVAQKTQEMTPIPCTRCGYCMPCPNGVNIPTNFAAYNMNYQYPENAAHRTLHSMQSPEQQASNCIQCGVCEEKCPQGIPIGEWMQKLANDPGFNS